MRPARLAMLLLAVFLVGCVTENRPENCDADETRIELTMTAVDMEPNAPAACIGQHVTMIVRSEVDGVFHIHGLDAVVPATTVSAGDEVSIEFTADRSGQFPIELHPADDPQGMAVGIFTVYER